VKILVDMNLAPRWVDIFRGVGIAASHWSNLGSYDAPDSEILEYAARDGWIILTHDLDFGAILAASTRRKPSVVQIRADDLRLESIARHVVAALRQIETELGAGALVTLEPGRTRVRILPFHRSLA